MNAQTPPTIVKQNPIDVQGFWPSISLTKLDVAYVAKEIWSHPFFASSSPPFTSLSFLFSLSQPSILDLSQLLTHPPSPHPTQPHHYHNTHTHMSCPPRKAKQSNAKQSTTQAHSTLGRLMQHDGRFGPFPLLISLSLSFSLSVSAPLIVPFSFLFLLLLRAAGVMRIGWQSTQVRRS